MTVKPILKTTILVACLLIVVALLDYFVQLDRSEGEVPPGTEADIGGKFTLIDHSGRQVTNADFADKYKLIFFGFTHCPDVCPTTLARLSKTLALLETLSDKLYPLFITVDPERDTPERLKKYSKSFDPRIIYLTGSDSEIAEVLKAWKATRAKVAAREGGFIGEGYSASTYSMNHSSVLYLMTPGNRLAASYNWEVSSEKMAESIGAWLEN
jgi:protein SCO1